VRKYFSGKQSSAVDAAAEIVRGSMRKESNVYFPSLIYLAAVMNAVMPDTFGELFRNGIKYP